MTSPLLDIIILPFDDSNGDGPILIKEKEKEKPSLFFPLPFSKNPNVKLDFFWFKKKRKSCVVC